MLVFSFRELKWNFLRRHARLFMIMVVKFILMVRRFDKYGFEIFAQMS
jgi:hypothetical protein